MYSAANIDITVKQTTLERHLSNQWSLIYDHPLNNEMYLTGWMTLLRLRGGASVST